MDSLERLFLQLLLQHQCPSDTLLLRTPQLGFFFPEAALPQLSRSDRLTVSVLLQVLLIRIQPPKDVESAFKDVGSNEANWLSCSLER